MRISQKAQHAVRALLDLAIHAPPAGGVRSSQIARRTGVPEKFLDAILLELRRAGLVASKRGRDGGHWLACDPSRVTVRAIVHAIDGPLSPAGRARRRAASPADACVSGLWERAEQAVDGVLEGVTLDDLRRQADPHRGLDFAI